MNELKRTKKVILKKKVMPEKKSKHLTTKPHTDDSKKMDKANC